MMSMFEEQLVDIIRGETSAPLRQVVFAFRKLYILEELPKTNILQLLEYLACSSLS